IGMEGRGVCLELKRPELGVRPYERHRAVDEYPKPAETRLIRKLRPGRTDGYFEQRVHDPLLLRDEGIRRQTRPAGMDERIVERAEERIVHSGDSRFDDRRIRKSDTVFEQG